MRVHPPFRPQPAVTPPARRAARAGAGLLARLRLGLLVLACLLAAGSALGRTVLDLDVARQPVALLDWADVAIDPTGRATAAEMDALPGQAWSPTSETVRTQLRPGMAVWIRLTVPPAPDAERWYLEVRDPHVDRVEVYTLDAASRWNAAVAGDTVPVAQWPVPHRRPLLPVAVSAEEPRRFMIAFRGGNGLDVPLRFVSESHLTRHEQRVALLLGICFGLGGLAAVVGVLGWISLRDSAHAAFGVCAALLVLLQSTVEGISGLHLWPWAAPWNDMAPSVLAALTAAAFVVFASSAVYLRDRAPALRAALWGLAALGCALAVALALLPAAWRGLLLPSYLGLATLVTLVVLLWSWRDGERHSPIFLAGLLPLLLGAGCVLAGEAGLLPLGLLAHHALTLAAVATLPLMVLLLMLRSQQTRGTRQRIRRLERVDPATGLLSQAEFVRQLGDTILRSRRLERQCGVLVVEVVNEQALAREFGRDSVAELPLRVAALLQAVSRGIDKLARLDDARFGMLVEGPLSQRELTELGPRIIARGLMPHRDKPRAWVLQLRVAVAVAPDDGDDPEQVLAELGGLLDDVPRESKRAVFHLGDGSTGLTPLGTGAR